MKQLVSFYASCLSGHIWNLWKMRNGGKLIMRIIEIRFWLEANWANYGAGNKNVFFAIIIKVLKQIISISSMPVPPLFQITFVDEKAGDSIKRMAEKPKLRKRLIISFSLPLSHFLCHTTNQKTRSSGCSCLFHFISTPGCLISICHSFQEWKAHQLLVIFWRWATQRKKKNV